MYSWQAGLSSSPGCVSEVSPELLLLLETCYLIRWLLCRHAQQSPTFLPLQVYEKEKKVLRQNSFWESSRHTEITKSSAQRMLMLYNSLYTSKPQLNLILMQRVFLYTMSILTFDKLELYYGLLFIGEL